MSYKAIIFDLDGTLLDTLKDLAFAVNAVLKKNGFEEHPIEAYRYFVGDGIDLLVERAFAAGRADKPELEDLVQAVKDEYGRRWSDHTAPYPEVPGLLDYLEKNAVPKAIFSNKPHQFAVLTVETLLPSWKFTDVYGIQPGMPRKPDPYGPLLIARKMAIDPSEIVYLGDTDTDMQTAVAGGFFGVGALWGFRPALELTEGGAKMLVSSPLDVIRLFKE